MSCACVASVDWQATGAMLQGWGTLLGAGAVLIAASMGFTAWKRQKIAERLSDHAEKILDAAYVARQGLRELRSIWMSAGELAAAEAMLDEKPDWGKLLIDAKRKRLVTTQAYFIRYNRLASVRAKVVDCLPMASALFGDELENALDKLHHQFWVVRVYAEAYAEDHNGNDLEFNQKIHKALYEAPDADQGGEVSKAIIDAIQTIERICVPALRLESA